MVHVISLRGEGNGAALEQAVSGVTLCERGAGKWRLRHEQLQFNLTGTNQFKNSWSFSLAHDFHNNTDVSLTMQPPSSVNLRITNECLVVINLHWHNRGRWCGTSMTNALCLSVCVPLMMIKVQLSNLRHKSFSLPRLCLNKSCSMRFPLTNGSAKSKVQVPYSSAVQCWHTVNFR